MRTFSHFNAAIPTILIEIARCGDIGSSQSANGKWLEVAAVLPLYLANTNPIMSSIDKEDVPGGWRRAKGLR